MIHILCYGIIRSIFSALKILCALPVHPQQTLATTDLFTVSIVLPFPECYYGFGFCFFVLVQLSLKCHRCSIIVTYVQYMFQATSIILSETGISLL